MQLIDSPLKEESSYKEDDEIDLEECFNKLDIELRKYIERQESKLIQLERDNSVC